MTRPTQSQDLPHSLNLQRREFKYLIPTHALDRIRRGLQGIASLDQHTGPSGDYEIRSLYLDTHDRRLFHANEREAHERYKVRVRCYPGVQEAPYFLEVKRRTGDVIRKTRVPVATRDWPRILRDPGHHAKASAFADLCDYRDLRPSSLVTYRREAWVSDLDDYARVTFDSRICCAPANRWSLEPNTTAWRPVDHRIGTRTTQGITVVEMKFAGAAPIWMHRLVQRLDLIRFAFSKYGESIHALTEPFDQRARAWTGT